MEIVSLNAFEDNYIWVLRADGCCTVIDPGDATPVNAWLEKSGDRLTAILVTHHHHDHTDGIADLVGHHDVPVFGPAHEKIPGITHPLGDGDLIALPELEVTLEVLDVPGHTRGHIAYYGANLPPAGALFCGDTLFGCGCGRLFEGTPSQMLAAMKRFSALPDETAIYCAHEYTASGVRFASVLEPDNEALRLRCADVTLRRSRLEPTVPFTLAEEKATSPFLRWNKPSIIAAVAHRLGHTPGSEEETFAAIREWRDHF
jgi:hydroxyacylglutathione hydrolase